MRLSDFRDEAALDLLADLIEPASEIIGDADVKDAVESGNRIRAVSIAIKNHKGAVLSILAALDGVPVEQFHCTVLTLPIKLLDILNDPDIEVLFSSADQTVGLTSSGPRTENTEDEGQ